MSRPTVESAEHAALVVADLAEQAARAGTFGVGAVLVDDRTGEVLDQAANSVIGDAGAGPNGSPTLMTRDPTAHGEMQLVGRYFQAVARGESLPEQQHLTIISSLEPCAMCAGAILTAGMKVGVVALDPEAGLGATGTDRFSHLPPGIINGAEKQFGYYEVEGLRPFTGSEAVVFGADGETRTITTETHGRCQHAFLGSLEGARSAAHEDDAGGAFPDLLELPSDDLIRRSIEERLAYALTVRVDGKQGSREELVLLMRDLVGARPESSGATGLIDPHGNLLAASAGKEHSDPTLSSMVEVIRAYSRLRFELVSNPDCQGNAKWYLPHLKYGRLIRYPVPDSGSPLTLMDLGVYGSTMEGPVPKSNRPNLLLVGDGQEVHGLNDLVEAMPPFYSETVGISFGIEAAQPD